MYGAYFWLVYISKPTAINLRIWSLLPFKSRVFYPTLSIIPTKSQISPNQQNATRSNSARLIFKTFLRADNNILKAYMLHLNIIVIFRNDSGGTLYTDTCQAAGFLLSRCRGLVHGSTDHGDDSEAHHGSYRRQIQLPEGNFPRISSPHYHQFLPDLVRSQPTCGNQCWISLPSRVCCQNMRCVRLHGGSVYCRRRQ